LNFKKKTGVLEQ